MCCGHCGSEDTSMACALCKQAKYCGAECMKKAWGTHQQECNTYVADTGVTLAVPYMYEDVAPSQALDQLPENSITNQSYMMTVFNTDGTVESQLLPTVAGVYSEADPTAYGARSAAPSLNDGVSASFSLRDLNTGAQSKKVRAELPYDVVSLDNEHNIHASRMAGHYLKGHLAPFSEGMTLRSNYNTIAWPAPQKVATAFQGVPLTQDGVYELEVETPEGSTQRQQFRILLDKSPVNALVGAEKKQLQQSKLGRFYRHMLKVQGNAANTDIALDHTGTYRFSMKDGSAIIMQVEMDGSVAHVRDIQLMQGYGHMVHPRYNPSPGRGLPKGVYQGRLGLAQRMSCDPGNLEDVSALRIALKNRVGDYHEVLDLMRAANTNPHCEVIRETAQKVRQYEGHLKELDAYRENLHRHGAEVVEAQPQIAALVGRIMQDQQEFVGAKMKEQTYAAKLLKDGVDAAEALTTEAIDRYQSAQEGVRKADQAIADSKARSKGAKTGAKLKESAKRVGLNAKKANAILKKRRAESTMKDVSAAVGLAEGSPLVTSNEIKKKLRSYMTRLREAKSRTGLSPQAQDMDEDLEDELDDEYSHHRSDTLNYSY